MQQVILNWLELLWRCLRLLVPKSRLVVKMGGVLLTSAICSIWASGGSGPRSSAALNLKGNNNHWNSPEQPVRPWCRQLYVVRAWSSSWRAQMVELVTIRNGSLEKTDVNLKPGSLDEVLDR